MHHQGKKAFDNSQMTFRDMPGLADIDIHPLLGKVG
jgi:hypothetical protein